MSLASKTGELIGCTYFLSCLISLKTDLGHLQNHHLSCKNVCDVEVLKVAENVEPFCFVDVLREIVTKS